MVLTLNEEDLKKFEMLEILSNIEDQLLLPLLQRQKKLHFIFILNYFYFKNNLTLELVHKFSEIKSTCILLEIKDYICINKLIVLIS